MLATGIFMNKYTFLICSTLLLSACAQQNQVPPSPRVVGSAHTHASATGGLSSGASLHTSVPDSSIDAITRDVRQWHELQHPNCRFAAVTTAAVVSQTEKTTVEHWTITACQQQEFTYKVLILRNTPGALSDAVSNVDESPAQSNSH
jgi:hypothetical protein